MANEISNWKESSQEEGNQKKILIGDIADA